MHICPKKKKTVERLIYITEKKRSDRTQFSFSRGIFWSACKQMCTFLYTWLHQSQMFHLRGPKVNINASLFRCLISVNIVERLCCRDKMAAEV